jgi:hypothetical protein
MTLDLELICISGVPIAGIAAIGTASVRHFTLGDDEFVGIAGTDHELALAAANDLARNGTFGEPMPQAIDHDLFEMSKRLGEPVCRRRCCEDWSVSHCAIRPSCP